MEHPLHDSEDTSEGNHMEYDSVDVPGYDVYEEDDDIVDASEASTLSEDGRWRIRLLFDDN